jgi:branched-chain amino acid aminotransferase
VNWNRERAPADSDFRISLIATPGVAGSAEPTCIATVSLLDFSEMQRRYREGVSLAVVSTREIPENSIPRSMKHRNRIHYWLAEQEAGRVLPGSRALLLDQNGFVCETTTTAIGFFKNRSTFVAPDEREILGSISLAKSIEFLKKAGYQVERARFSVEELLESEEVLLFNALMPIAPVSRVIAGEKSREFGANWKANPPCGAGFGVLIEAWSQFCHVDLQRQADRGGEA